MENKVSNSQAWTFFADKNLALAEFIAERPEFTGELAFHCQQSVEKYLKAYLMKSKIPFKKTHDLVELYHKVKEIKDLYTEVRYPSNIGFLADGSLPSQEKAKIYLAFTKSVASVIKSEIEKT